MGFLLVVWGDDKSVARTARALLARRAALDPLAEAALDFLLRRVGQLLLDLAEAAAVLGLRLRQAPRGVRLDRLLRSLALLVVPRLVALLDLLGRCRVLVLYGLSAGILGAAL